MIVTPRLTVADVLRADPTMAQALGIAESQAPSHAPKVQPPSRSDAEFSRGAARQRDEIAARTSRREPEPSRREPEPRPEPSPAADPEPGVEIARAQAREQARDLSRDLSDVDRFRQREAAKAVSAYEAVQAVDRRLPSGSSGVDGRA